MLIFSLRFSNRQKKAKNNDVTWVRLEKWNRILGIICLLISTLTSIKLYYQKASVRTED